MLQLAVRWTGQSQLDQATPQWTGRAATEASSWSVKVTEGEADLKFVVQSRHRKLLVRETLFLAMARACGTEEFLKVDAFNIFLSSDLSFLSFGVQGGTITATAETGAAVQSGKFKRKSGLSLTG